MMKWENEFVLSEVKAGAFVLAAGEELAVETKIDHDGFFWVMDECGIEFDMHINDVDALKVG